MCARGKEGGRKKSKEDQRTGGGLSSVVLVLGSNLRNPWVGERPSLFSPPTSPYNAHPKDVILSNTMMLSFGTEKDSDGNTHFYKILLGRYVVKIKKC